MERQKGCLKATVKAIEIEIGDYNQRLKLAERGVGPAGNTQRFKKKIEELRTELEKFRNMKPEEYMASAREDHKKKADFFDEILKTGPVIPPEKVAVSILADEKCRDGVILNVIGMTRSGPFYHVAGIVDDDYGLIKPNKKYELTIYLIYKREYVAFIPDYYVYIARVQESSSL